MTSVSGTVVYGCDVGDSNWNEVFQKKKQGLGLSSTLACELQRITLYTITKAPDPDFPAYPEKISHLSMVSSWELLGRPSSPIKRQVTRRMSDLSPLVCLQCNSKSQVAITVQRLVQQGGKI